MTVVMNFPKTAQGMKELENRVAAAHAMAAKNYIKNLSCPAEQKVKLINAITS